MENSDKLELKVVLALLNKGIKLLEKNKPQNAITAFNELIGRFEHTTKTAFQELVARAEFGKGIAFKRQNKPQNAITAFDELIGRFKHATKTALQELIARAMLNKGLVFEEQNKREDEIAAYDKLVSRFKQSTDLEIQALVAKALFYKGSALGKLAKPKEEIATYDELISRFEQSNNPEIQVIVAKALLIKGLMQMDQTTIDASDKLLSRFEQADNPDLQVIVAMALFIKGFALGELGELESEISIYDKMLSRFEQTSNQEIQQLVAKALLNKSVVSEKLNKPGDEIAAYYKLVSQFEQSDHPEIQVLVAKALFGLGIMLGDQGKDEKAIAAFEKLLTRFEQSNHPEIQVIVATALLSRSITNKLEDEIVAYDKLLARFAQSDNLKIQSIVATALFNKGVALEKLGITKDAIAVYNKLATQFKKSTNPQLQLKVAQALLFKGLVLSELDNPKNAIFVYNKLISQFEQNDDFKIQKFVKLAFFNKGIACQESGRKSNWHDSLECFKKYLEKTRLPWNNLYNSIIPEKDLSILLWSLIFIFEKCNEKIQEAQIQESKKENIPQQVCHFTDLNALYSIMGYSPGDKELKNGKNVLRAYNAIYMNDPNEGKALVEYSNKRHTTNKNIFDLTEFFKDAEHNWIDHDAAKSVYCISFTADNDSLTLWRAYGRDGYGVCIVIPVKSLNQSDGDNLIVSKYFQKLKFESIETKEMQLDASIFIAEDSTLKKTSKYTLKKNPENTGKHNEAISENLFKVKYINFNENENKSKKDDEKFADDFLKSLKKPLKEINRIKEKYKDAKEEINKATREAFAGALYLFKDAQYESEHEYRMLEMRQIDDKGIFMDEQIPPRLYLETRPFVFEDPGTRLIIGPAVENLENVELSIEYIRTKPNPFLKKIKVQRSTVNYRPAKK